MWPAVALVALSGFAVALGVIVHAGTRTPTPQPNEGGDDEGGAL